MNIVPVAKVASIPSMATSYIQKMNHFVDTSSQGKSGVAKVDLLVQQSEEQEDDYSQPFTQKASVARMNQHRLTNISSSDEDDEEVSMNVGRNLRKKRTLEYG